MATRTRSRAKQQSQEEVQTKITNTFSTTRRGLSSAKSVKVTVFQDTIPKSQTKSDLKSKRVKKEVVSIAEAPAEVKVEVEAPDVLHSPPRRPRKTPTPPCSPPREQQHPAARRLFQDEPETNKAVEPSQTVSSAISPPFDLKEKAAATKKTKVNLQERLAAANPSLAKVHAQLAANKAKQVSDHADLLRSPVKASTSMAPPLPLSPAKKLAPVFLSPTKRPATIKIAPNLTSPPPKNVPEFVLPTHKTPAKEVDQEEIEKIEMEKSMKFEKGHTARLKQEVKRNNQIELPNKYKNLLTKFHGCDRIVSIFTNRGSKCEIEEIFRNVKKMISQDFNRTHLAQIIALYPKSYHISLTEKRNLAGQATGQFDMILKPNLEDDLTEFMRPESPKKALLEPLPMVMPGPCLSPMKSPRKKIAQPLPREVEVSEVPRLECWRMQNRKYIMHHLLAERVKKCNAKFLEKLGEDPSGINFLHPAFLAKIDTACEDIELGVLPEPEKKNGLMKDVTDFMKLVKQPETAIDVALKELSSKAEVSISRNIPLSPKKFAEMKAEKPMGTRNLLDRIREKESKKKEQESSRDPEAEHRYFCLELLHTKIIRPMLTQYTMKNCKSTELNLLVEKIEYLSKRNKEEIRDSIQFLCAVAPNIAKIVEVASRKYLQIEQTRHDELRSAVKAALEATPKPSFPSGVKGR